ncbi:hypothetical protein GQ600_18149 [Phytophthora cactorum]|nr:hypothetical protein GQ600_18149 [Phytophthora cactorum]
MGGTINFDFSRTRFRYPAGNTVMLFGWVFIQGAYAVLNICGSHIGTVGGYKGEWRCGAYSPAAVQSLLNLQTKPQEEGWTSSYYCLQCSEGKRGLVTLCNKARDYTGNEGLICSQIWHVTWRNGEFAPKAVPLGIAVRTTRPFNSVVFLPPCAFEERHGDRRPRAGRHGAAAADSDHGARLLGGSVRDGKARRADGGDASGLDQGQTRGNASEAGDASPATSLEVGGISPSVKNPATSKDSPKRSERDGPLLRRNRGKGGRKCSRG